MQRFVALSSSQQSLVLSPVSAWKGTRDGVRASVSVESSGGCRRNANSNRGFNALPVIVRGGDQPRRNITVPDSVCGRGGGHGIRSQSVSRGAIGNRPGGTDPADGLPDRYHHHHQHHHHHHHHLRRPQRNHPLVADSIRDYASQSWWTDDADSDSDEDSAKEDWSLSPDLWTSRIILQLSLFWNLLGYSPSRVDEWLVSHEARRRLNSLNKKNRFSSTAPSASSALNNPLGDLFERDSSLDLDSLQKKLFSVRFPQILATSTPLLRPRERLSIATENLPNLVYPEWLTRMTKTYGASFLMLVSLGYVTQGFRCFPWFAVGYMLKDGLQVDPGYMQFLLSSAALPMVLKPIYGIVSDTVYIRGAHRVPYLAIAGLVQLISWGALALSPMATSSAVILTAALTLGNLGAAIADVMNDALVAEVSKKQKGSGSGELQSFAWLAMASGGLMGNLLGGFALKQLQLTSMYFIFLIFLGLHLVTCLFVSERSFGLAPPIQPAADMRSSSGNLLDGSAIYLDDVHRKKKQAQRNKAVYGGGLLRKMRMNSRPNLYYQLKDQVRLLGELLKKKEISHTLLWFCASYAIVPVLGSSIFFYQTQVLRIDPMFIGFSRMIGQVALMVGSQLYGGVLKGFPLRKLLGAVQLLLSICMLSDLLLVKRVNLLLGIPDQFYVLGASALVDCISQFKVLPVIVRLGQLCPPGSEGSLMAFFSSCHCLAGLCSGYFGVFLAQSLHISAQSFDGLPVGIFISAMFALVPILFISLIPGEDAVTVEKVAEKVL